MKKDFKTIYKSIVPEQPSASDQVLNDPIKALLTGTPVRTVVETLRNGGWPEGEIAKLLEHLEEVKSAIL